MAYSKRTKRKIFLWVGGIILFLLFFSTGIHWIVKWDWLAHLGYAPVFWKIKGTELLLFAVALVVALLYLIPNMRWLSKNVSFIRIDLSEPPFDQVGIKYINEKQIRVVTYIFAALLGFIFASSFYAKWEEWFRFLYRQPFHQSEPVFGHDISFYVFQLPFLETVQNNLTFLVFVVTLFTFIVYAAKGKISLQTLRQGKNGKVSSALKHLSYNLGGWFILLGAGYFLDRYQLLFDHKGVVQGAGYTAVHINLPVIFIMMILCWAMALFTFYQVRKIRLKKMVWGAVLLLGIGIIGQAILPGIVRSYIVKPNELKLEKPYLKTNIALTRKAYGLDHFEVTNYNALDSVNYTQVQNNIQTIDNIRLWDPRLLIHTYRQLQEIRLYYNFPSVSLDRYHTNLGYQQMMLSARELNLAQLPRNAQTWVNRHLQYTHGYGIAMSPVTKTNEEGGPKLLIKDLPPVSTINIKLTQPAIYYGEGKSTYKLVNTKVKELDYPKGKNNVYTHYQGTGGVPVDGFFRKIVYASFLSDYNILLTDYIQPGTRLQFWQNIHTRIHQIAPFLIMKDKPYLVVANGKLYWIQDTFTHSGNYPYSQPYYKKYNYIRNAVKVVVDAYNGSVQFYVSDAADPIIQAYQKIFPKLFKPMHEMPKILQQHIRYPEFLFKVQMEIYNTYHMTNVHTFYNKEDLWGRPNSKYAGQQILMDPYYILSKLPDQKQLQYLLISPLTPHNRDNMISWMAAESDFPNYGKVHVYELPKSRLFLGPAQIEAKIDQNTDISRLISLWDQHGSNVVRGNLMVIPLDESFLYVEPVFLIAEGVNIPQLKRVIVTDGEQVIMRPTIHQAINTLFHKKPTQQIVNQPVVSDSAKITSPAISTKDTRKLRNLEELWKNLQHALEKQKWTQFGQQMQKIDSLLQNGVE